MWLVTGISASSASKQHVARVGGVVSVEVSPSVGVVLSTVAPARTDDEVVIGRRNTE
jgi:hypothetical protein